jgi:multicomponent Na+:H+ antiporter subunit F
MKLLRWLVGIFILGLTLGVIIFNPPPFLFAKGLPHAAFLGKALYIFILAGLMCVFRVMRGPTAPDRIVSVDIFGFMLVGLCAILTIVTGRPWYIDIGIAWALQDFVTILALSKYLEGKGFDE